MQAHLQWTRRVLRCAVLHSSPGDDVFKSEAHTLCRLASWLLTNRREFDALDPEHAGALEADHKALHDAVRSICARTLAGRPGEPADLDAFESAQSALIGHLAQFKTLAIERDSLVDPLTGLPMRHRMIHDYDLLRRQIGRYGNAPLVLMIDIDLFKRVNDRHGRAGGDVVLRSLAQALREAIRRNDQVYRYGGEEFLALLSLAEPGDAESTIRKLLDKVRAVLRLTRRRGRADHRHDGQRARRCHGAPCRGRRPCRPGALHRQGCRPGPLSDGPDAFRSSGRVSS